MLKKKILSMLIAVAMMLSIVPGFVFAEDEVLVAAEAVEINEGTTTASVKINVSNNTGMAYLGVKVGYDSTVMALSSAVAGEDVFEKSQVTLGKVEKNPYTISATSSTENKTGNGNFVTLNFTVNADCPLGEYPITLTLNGAYDVNEAKVNVSVVSGSITVKEKPKENFKLSFTDGKCTYDGNEHTLKVEGLPEDSDANVEYAVEGPVVDGKAIDAGEYKITATVTKDGYNDWTGTATLTIEPKDVTITVHNAAKTVGQDDPKFNYTVTGEVTEGDITGIELSRVEGETAGTYAINAVYDKNSNYNVKVVNGTLTITDKLTQNVTVEGVVTEKTYGDEGFKVKVTLDETSNLDKFTITSSDTDVAEIDGEGNVTIKNAGTATIAVNVEGNDVYAPFEQSWTLTVVKKGATITVNDATKTAGQGDPEFSYTVTGEVTEGDITGITLERKPGDEVGTYKITAKYTKNDNYDVTVVDGTLTINKRAQIITVSEIPVKQYGDSFTIEATSDSTSPVTFNYSSDNTDVATVDESGNVTVVAVGNANITVTAPENAECNSASVTKELVAVERDITITAIVLVAEEKTAIFSGVVAGDTVELDFDKLDVKVTNAEDGKAEVSNFVLIGEKAANYNVTNEKLTDVAVTVADASNAGVAPEGVTATVNKAEAAKTVIITSMDTTGFEGETLALDATKADATVETVQIPKTAFVALKETDTKLEVKLASGSAVFDKKALEAVAGSEGTNVSLKITEPDDSRLKDAQVEAKKDLANHKVYSFEINDGTIADFAGGIVTVTVEYSKGNGNVKAKYLKNDGTTENVSSVKYDEYTDPDTQEKIETVTLELSHFSEYVIYTEPQGSRKPSNSGVVANVGIKNNGEEKPAEEVKEPEETKDPEEQTPAAGKFTDVPAWAEKAVENLSNLGIVSGRGEGKFDPNGKVTRAEFAVMIARMFSLDVADGESTFVDCTKDDWFAPHVNAAAKAGFISGVGEGKFNPSATISRQDICTILGRALKVAATKDLSFADSADIAAYANEYVKAFAELGVVSGYENGTFAPKANASRAEAAAILNNVINLDLEVVKEAIAKLTAAVEK